MPDEINKTDGVLFEKAMARLDEIVALMEKNNLPLEEGLALYEEGISLVRLCSDQLSRAEQRVKILSRGEGNAIVTRDFTPTEQDT